MYSPVGLGLFFQAQCANINIQREKLSGYMQVMKGWKTEQLSDTQSLESVIREKQTINHFLPDLFILVCFLPACVQTFFIRSRWAIVSTKSPPANWIISRVPSWSHYLPFLFWFLKCIFEVRSLPYGGGQAHMGFSDHGHFNIQDTDSFTHDSYRSGGLFPQVGDSGIINRMQ